MSITYTFKEKLEDIVGDVDVISDWDNNKMSLLINHAFKDLVRRMRMINPDKLWDFSSEFVSLNDKINYSVQIGSGTIAEGSGIYDEGVTKSAFNTPDIISINDKTFATNADATGVFSAGDYFIIADDDDVAGSRLDHEIMQVVTISGTSPFTVAVRRGCFGTIPQKHGATLSLWKISVINEVLDVLNVKRRLYYKVAPIGSTNQTNVEYSDYIASEARGHMKAQLSRPKQNINSFFKVNEHFPVFTKTGKTLQIFPGIDATQQQTDAQDARLVIDAVTVPYMSTQTLSQPWIENLQLEYQDIILLWMALDVLRLKIKQEESNLVSYTQLPAVAHSTLSSPGGTISNYSFTETFNMSSVNPIGVLDADAGLTAPTFVPALLDNIVDPTISDLNISVAAPSLPSDLNLTLSGATVSLPTFTNMTYSPESLSLDASPTYDTIVMPDAPTINISVADISDYIGTTDINVPTVLSLDTLDDPPAAPTISSVTLPSAPTLDAVATTLLSGSDFTEMENITLTVPGDIVVGVPDILSTLDSLPSPSAPTIADMSYTTIGDQASSPSAVTFPAAPAIPDMGTLPSAPNIETDFGDVTHTVAPVGMTLPDISDPTIGPAPSFDDYSIDQQFTASWSTFATTGMTSEWGHDLLDESGTNLSAKPWSFEHALQVEEDPEVAELRLKQMAVEVDRWKSKNEVLARAYEAEMSGYVESIRAQVAKIQGEGEIASALAKTAIASVQADAAVIDGQVASIRGKADAQRAKSEAYLAEVNAKVAAFDGQATALSKIYVSQVQGLAQQYSVEAEFNVSQYTSAFQAQIALYKSNLDKEIQLYMQKIQSYSTETQYQIKRWEAVEFQGKLQKWSIEAQTKIAEFNANLGSSLQEHAQKIAQKEKKFSAVLQAYGLEVQKVNTKYQSDLQKYGQESNNILQKYVAERDYEMAKWRDKEQLDIQKYTAKHQVLIQDWAQRLGAEIQKKQLTLSNNTAKTQADVAQYGARLQKQSQDFGLQIQTYSAEVQAIVSKHQSEMSLKYQSWVNTQNNKIAKYQSDVGQKMQEFQALIQQESSKFSLELNKFNTELQRHTAGVQTDSQEFQANLGKYTSALQQYQSDIQKQVTEYTTNLSHVMNIWNTNKQSNLQEYQGKIATQNTKVQTELQVYINDIQTKIGEFNAQTNSETQRYHAQVREEAGRYQLIMQEAVQDFQAGLQKYSTENQMIFQQNQEKIALYSADIQKYQLQVTENIQKKSLDVQDVQARIGIYNQQYQVLAERYERSFIPYQPQGQQQQQQQGG